jgi:cysteine desulfuration protein SufE
MIESRIAALKKIFEKLSTPESRYTYLIDLGRTLPPYPAHLRTPDHIVPGCQSTLYLAATLQNDRLLFSAQSDALISAGLAALLLSIYSDATPKEILTTPPTFLQELNLFASLSPSRSNGLASIYRRVQQLALNQL